MKNHKNLIRLIIATAALVAVGVFAFKYLRTYNLSELYHHKHAQVEVIDQLQKNEALQQNNTDLNDNVVIQKASPGEYCTLPTYACSSSSKPCCFPSQCSGGFCIK